jgi:hypothetical protein
MAKAKPTLSDPTRDEMLSALAQSSADEFDIEAAIYWFASDWHSGQWSNLYSALCTSPYKPGLSEVSCPDEAMDCYDTLVSNFVAPVCEIQWTENGCTRSSLFSLKYTSGNVRHWKPLERNSFRKVR